MPIPLAELSVMKETQLQRLAAFKAGTLGARGKKRKMDDSSDDRTDTSAGDTLKEKHARKSQTGGNIIQIMQMKEKETWITHPMTDLIRAMGTPEKRSVPENPKLGAIN